jgi:hypothetical protein
LLYPTTTGPTAVGTYGFNKIRKKIDNDNDYDYDNDNDYDDGQDALMLGRLRMQCAPVQRLG